VRLSRPSLPQPPVPRLRERDFVSADRPSAPVELLRVDPDLLEVTAQLLWVAAPGREVMRGEIDDAGLVRLLVDAPLSEREARGFESGLAALLTEPWAREAGTYLREVRDRAGRRRELATPTAPAAWQGRPSMVGPFGDEGAARAWSLEHVVPPLVGDVLPHAGRLYVDVFEGDDGGERSG
jgi:hypothetical protein